MKVSEASYRHEHKNRLQYQLEHLCQVWRQAMFKVQAAASGIDSEITAGGEDSVSAK